MLHVHLIRLEALVRVLAMALVLLTPMASSSHIKLTSPQGRMGTTDAAKFMQPNPSNPTTPDNPGPCATFNTPMATRLQLQPGAPSSVVVQETINHPGRFYVQFSQDGSTGFWDLANRLALVADTQNNGTTTINFTVPNTVCSNCVLRVLQEMDDQPGQFYVHCVDVRIGTTASPTPSPSPTPNGGGTTTLSSNSANGKVQGTKPGLGGCGTISSGDKGGGPGGGPGRPGAVLLSLIAPLFLILCLRRRFAT